MFQFSYKKISYVPVYAVSQVCVCETVKKQHIYVSKPVMSASSSSSVSAMPCIMSNSQYSAQDFIFTSEAGPASGISRALLQAED